MSVFVDQIIDRLAELGAFEPSQIPGAPPELGMFFTNPEDMKPAAAPLVRFHRAVNSLHAKGESLEPVQRFFRWQHQFILQGIQIYFELGPFLDWMKQTLPHIAKNPLPDSYRALVREHILKSLAHEHGIESFPVLKSDAVNDKPLEGIAKESRGDLREARAVFTAFPHLLETMAVFQGLHLEFLQAIVERSEERKIFSAVQQAVVGEATMRLATNFTNANFIRPAIWTALAYQKRTQGQPGELSADDFAAGWRTVEIGGGLVTKITSSSKPKGDEVKSKSSAAVVCPYHKPGRAIVAAELCGHHADEASPTKSSAYGLWCIYNLLKRTSSPESGPHQGDLAAIAEVSTTQALNRHSYFLERPNGATFIAQIRQHWTATRTVG